MKVVITGQEGFIGYHLFNSIKFKNKNLSLINFHKEYFDNDKKLDEIFNSANVIVHLAGLNRADDQKFLYNENLSLSKKILNSLHRINFSGKLIFASSTQENQSNSYARSKRESRLLFEIESKKNGFDFIGLIIPNVFGPFSRPNHNSFISTFCNNILLNKKNTIIKDNKIKLIYIDKLIKEILDSIVNDKKTKIIVKEDLGISVSEVKNIIQRFYDSYIINETIPELNSDFEINLFNTFVSAIKYEDIFPKKIDLKTDSRGIFSEVIRSINQGQYSYSITNIGQTRGNHFHTRKLERFLVISGSAKIELRKIGTNDIISFDIDGDEPAYVDMMPWYTHNLTNTGKTPLITLFWINEFYNESDSDTFFEKV